MIKPLIASLILLISSLYTIKAQETTIYPSPHSYETTVERMYTILGEKNLVNEHFKVEKYAEDSTDLKIKLTVFEFSDSEFINQIIVCEPTAALDMPYRIIVWQEDLDVFVGFVDPIWLKRRFMIQDCKSALDNYTKLLIRVANETIRAD